MSTTKKSTNSLFLLWLTAAIWGFAFVAQRKGMEYIGPFLFNAIRFILGSIPIIILAFIKLKNKSSLQLSNNIKNGLIAGIVLFIAASLQQAGMIWTTAGKAGFITGTYIVLVPLFGILLGQHLQFKHWLGLAITLCGLFLLTIDSKFSIQKGDLLIMLSAIFWAIHVLLIDKFTNHGEPILLSSVQFIVCGLISFIVALFIEPISTTAISQSLIPLLYGGFLSVGIAYTLQVVAQKTVKPSYAALILSFETVFAAIGGWLILGEKFSLQSLAGCILMFIGMLSVLYTGKYVKTSQE